MNRRRLRIRAAEGHVETVVNDPEDVRRGLALIAHPHPLHGGSLDNKVVFTLAKTVYQLGHVAIRANFRGVGLSDGVHDQGVGETEDMRRVADFACMAYGGLPLSLLGFSFGAYVQARLSQHVAYRRLVLVAPAVTMYEFGPLPAHTHVIQGALDELVPVQKVREWCAAHGLTLHELPGADHFFHGQLGRLAAVVREIVGEI
jgi:alpha/beta superfamily hydrolase